MAANVFLPTQRHLLAGSTLQRICSVVKSWILASRWKHFLASLHALSFFRIFLTQYQNCFFFSLFPFIISYSNLCQFRLLPFDVVNIFLHSFLWKIFLIFYFQSSFLLFFILSLFWARLCLSNFSSISVLLLQ